MRERAPDDDPVIANRGAGLNNRPAPRAPASSHALVSPRPARPRRGTDLDRLMRLLLLVPDGVGVRNFLQDAFVRRAVAAGEVGVLHAIPDALLGEYPALARPGVTAEPLVDSPGTGTLLVLRAALAYAQMYWADTQSMRVARRLPVRGSLRTRAAYGAARVLGASAAWPGGLATLDRLHRSV